uniref:B3 domain-containing protein n=1 Tax=Noccaea caerulescens TaxID=107243 RepID=A0A1J3I5H5_NOCCA
MLTERGGGSFANVLARGGSLSSSVQRMLPPDFLERTTHNLTDEVELEVVWGSSWMIPLVRNERGDVFFEKQKWCEFVDDNCLTQANFVVFEHKRDNYLFVIIFGEDGTQIMENPIRSCCTSPADSP